MRGMYLLLSQFLTQIQENNCHNHLQSTHDKLRMNYYNFGIEMKYLWIGYFDSVCMYLPSLHIRIYNPKYNLDNYLQFPNANLARAITVLALRKTICVLVACTKDA